MKVIGGKIARENAVWTEYYHQRMRDRVAEESERQKEGKAARKDFVHYLLKSRDPVTGKGYTIEQLQAESGLLIVAGSDTSSTTLAALFFYLLHNPQCLQKVTAEIRSSFTDVEEIHIGPKLSSLVYLRACIDETLRISPPLPSHLPREVLAGGIDLDGHHIPAGFQVGTSCYALHHNEEYYPQAFTFKPERWIPDPVAGITAESVDVARSAFSAFSLGSRGCIGKGVAYMEMTIAMSRCLYLYDIRKAEGDRTGAGAPDLGFGRRRRDEFQIHDYFVANRDGPVVEFKKREGVEVK